MRLKEKYQKEIVPALKEEFSYSNTMLVPRLRKVVINVGCGRQSSNKEALERISNNLAKLSGQKPVFAKAKKSVAAFKIRDGMTVGVKVTLRGPRMYDFVDKLVNITFPRVRDFRGLATKSIDEQGNMTIGFRDQSAFPEMTVEDIDHPFGLEVSLDTTAKSKEEGLALLRLMGFPFQKEDKKVSK